MAVRRLYEPLCIAFGTTVSSPTVPTYQLYDLPHKFTPRLYMESEDPNLVLREIGVWAGWEQAGSANTRSFLLDLLKDEDAHDNFLVREASARTRSQVRPRQHACPWRSPPRNNASRHIYSSKPPGCSSRSAAGTSSAQVGFGCTSWYVPWTTASARR